MSTFLDALEKGLFAWDACQIVSSMVLSDGAGAMDAGSKYTYDDHIARERDTKGKALKKLKPERTPLSG